MSLTRRQRAIYDFIVEEVRGNGIPPTMMEIATAFGLRSAGGVSDHLRAIERKGFIRRRPGASRGIEIHHGDTAADRPRQALRVPVSGRVPGVPETAPQRREVLVDIERPSGDLLALELDVDLPRQSLRRGDVLVIERRRATPDSLALARQGRRLILVRMDSAARHAVPLAGAVRAREALDIIGPVRRALRYDP